MCTLPRIPKIILGIGLFLGTFTAHLTAMGQNDPCGADAYHAERMLDPSYAAMVESVENAYQASIGQNSFSMLGGTNTYIIPCVVHVLYDNQIIEPSEPAVDAENTPDQNIINAICLANKHLAGQDGNGIQVGPDTHIQLRLATIDPDGNPTTGILHHQVAQSCAFLGGCITISAMQAQFGWDQSSYLNIFSVDALGSYGLSALFQQVVVENRQLNFAYPQPLQYSKTLAHEVAHYFNVRHVFNNGCHAPADCLLAGDYVCDTEQALASSPPNGATYVDCPSDCPLETGFWPRYNHMAYAQYTSNRFTLGQIARMESALQTPQGQTHWSEANLLATGTADPYTMSCCPLGMALTVVQPSCNGNGSISINVTGSSGAHVIRWYDDTHVINGQSGTSLMNLPAGYYDVQVTDVSGCFIWTHVVLNEWQPISIDGIASPDLCTGGPSGQIQMDITGGVPPFSFVWSGPGGFTATTEDLTDLSPGAYNVMVTDDAGCVGTAGFTVGATCCEADIHLPDGALSSGIGTVLSGTVDIQGQFIIDNDFTFSGATVYMEPAAEIVVQDGATLTLNGTSIRSCAGVMWKSITVQSGGGVYSYNSFIDDAESAIVGLDGSVIVSDNTQYHGNRVGISVPEVNGVAWNNVAMALSNNFFYSQGTMAQPYAGQTTAIGDRGFAAIDAHNTQVDLVGGGNTVVAMSNGVVAHQSHVNVSDCTFQEIQPDAAYSTQTGNGSAVYARGDLGFYYMKENSSVFTNCRWGMYTEYMSIRSEQNLMNNVGTAYRVEKSSYRDVDIWNNTVDTRFDGMQLYFNDGCAHLLVENNDITFATNPPPGQFVKGYTAIKVLEANTANPSSAIQNNTIHYRAGASTANKGIYLNATNDYQVIGNTLLMHNNAVNYSGIHMNDCNRALISCNNVQGSFSNYNADDGQSAIRTNSSASTTIYCNTVDGTTNGIYFSGPSYGTDLGGNNIHDHKWGLHLDYNAVIEEQDHKGNLWFNSPQPGGVGAWYENAVNAFFYPFKFDPTTVGLGDPEPPSRTPFSWFISETGQNYLCDDDGGSYCAELGHVRCAECKTGLDEKIAQDLLQNNPYTEETKWIMKGELYEKLETYPELIYEDQELADFYDAMQGTTEAQFKLINNDYLTVFDVAPSVRAYLDQNRDQLALLMADLKNATDQLADQGLTPAQRQALLTTISGLQTNITDLTALNKQALEALANSKALSTESVKNTNAAVGTSQLIEDNEKQVNDIYLRTVAKGIDGFSTADANTLFAIADQCPLVGGNAVYRARSLYALINDDQEYDDPALCLVHGITVRSMEGANAQQQHVQVMPNPASDEAVLVCQLGEGMTGTLVLYDAMGKQVARFPLSAEVQRHPFSTANLVAGNYHYQVATNSGVLGDGKLTIVR